MFNYSGPHMKLGIMQPYFLPYIGYFQLVKAVDKFIFYDDVNYIKNGWINRNRILLNGEAHYITVHQKGASPNKLINEVEIIDNRHKLKKKIYNAYVKAPYFREAWPFIEKILEFETEKISELAVYSVIQTCKYLGIDTRFEFSGVEYGHTANLKLEKRLIAICNLNNASEYINPIGGIELYDKEIFLKEGITLSFLRTTPITYRQFDNLFIENLSIIDVMMFNSNESIKAMLNCFDIL
jgi:hypothetical protein